MRLITTTLAVLSLTAFSHSKPDWNDAKQIHLIRGHESTTEVMEMDFYFSGDLRLLEFKTAEGTFRHLITPSAILYDFLEEKGIVSWEEGRSIVQDTSSIMHSKATEIIYLLDRAVEASKSDLPSEIRVSLKSKTGNEKVMINPGDHIRYKRPWRLKGSVRGYDIVEFSFIQTFGKDKEGTTFEGFVNFKETDLPIEKEESLSNWLVISDDIDPSTHPKTIDDILKNKSNQSVDTTAVSAPR